MAPRFVACFVSPAQPSPPRLMAFRRDAAARGGDEWSNPRPGLHLLSDRRTPIAVRHLSGGQGVVVGDLFTREDAAPAPPHLDMGRPAGPEAIARRLLATTWGSYVALMAGAAADTAAIFRDPSGALDCVTWRRDGVTFVTSDLQPWMKPHLPTNLTIDWGRVGHMLIDPSHIAGAIALVGIHAVDPGVLRLDHPAGAETRRLWRPGDFVEDRTDAVHALKALPRQVDACVGAWSKARGVLIAELSGGLDSALVGSALTRSGASVAQWVNYHVADRQGDERIYARLVAGRLGAPLLEAAKPEARLDPQALQAAAFGARPSLNGLDQDYDRDLAERCGATGASAVLTGQGGDTVFYQMPTALVLADRLREGGLRALTPQAVADIARWTRQSAWRVLRIAAAANLGLGAKVLRDPSDLLSRDLAGAARDTPPPAWAADLERVAPGKRRQIQGLAHTQNFFGACARGRAADLIHPLLSQPIVELALSISAADLTEGGRDRGLVRRAYADRLPQALLARRSKGVLSAYYGRMVSTSLPEIRPWLLEGPLVRAGLLDRDRLETRLDPDDLIWRGRYTDVTTAAAIQAWAAHWL